MSEIIIQIDKADFDGGFHAYRCSTYDSIDDSKSQHVEFTYITEVLEWAGELLEANPEANAWYTSKYPYDGQLKDVIERWKTVDSPVGEHPADTEWRDGLGEVHPQKHIPNRVY
jgi:hypothetical protein